MGLITDMTNARGNNGGGQQVNATPGVNTPTIATPGIVSPDSSGLLAMIGRLTGANQMSGGFDAQGNYTPYTVVNPKLDAVFNAGQANKAAFANNQQIGISEMSNNQQLQQKAAQLQNDIALGNASEANKEQLAQTQTQLDQSTAKLNQGLGQATNAGVVAANPSTGVPTVGMNTLAGDASSNQAQAASALAGDKARVYATPDFGAHLGSGMSAQAYSPVIDNLAKQQLVVPGVGGYTPTPQGNLTIAKQPDNSASSTTVQPFNMGGTMIPEPVTQSQAKGGGADISFQTNPSIVSNIIGGQQGQTNMPRTQTTGRNSILASSPMVSGVPPTIENAIPAGSQILATPGIQGQMPVSPTQQIRAANPYTRGHATPVVKAAPGQSMLQRVRNYMLLHPKAY